MKNPLIIQGISKIAMVVITVWAYRHHLQVSYSI